MHEDPPDQKIIYVNTKRVGYLIGHHGRTIILFQQQSGAKIDIMAPNSRAKETPVKISGSSENVGRALRLILDLFSLDNYSSRYWQQMKEYQQCNNKAIIGHEETRVPSYFAEFLRVSESISKIEKDSGSKVIVLPENDVDTSFYIINVIGTAEGNTRAFDILNERYREVEEANQHIPKAYMDQHSLIESNVSSNDPRINRKKSVNVQKIDIMDMEVGKSNQIVNDETTLSGLDLEKRVGIPKKVLNFIRLQPICRKNQVKIEIEQTSECPQDIYEQIAIISGSETNVETANGDLSNEIEEWLDHLSKNESGNLKQHENGNESMINKVSKIYDFKSFKVPSLGTENKLGNECKNEVEIKEEHNKCSRQSNSEIGLRYPEMKYEVSPYEVNELDILSDKINESQNVESHAEHPFSNINQDGSFLDCIESKGHLRNEYSLKPQKLVN